MTDNKRLEQLKKVIRKQIAEVKGNEAPMSMHEMGVALTKAASMSLKIIENLKSKSKMPSKKAQMAIDNHIEALERILNDMWQSPLSYLDATPDEVVAQRRADLEDRESSLVDHNVHEGKQTCGCENLKCEREGKHSPGSCMNSTGSRRALYVGPVCDDCAAGLSPEYMKESSKENKKEKEHGENPNMLSAPTHCDTCGKTFDAKISAGCPQCSEINVKEWANKLRSKYTSR